MSKSRTVAALAVAALLPSLTACGTAAGQEDGALSIVASTDVWGDIAAEIGGDRVEVTSIIDSPDKDPHEYEATARDQLAVSRADIVIENGGGYDSFMDTLLDASGAEPEVIEAVEESGLAPDDDHAEAGAEHEHVEGEADHEHAEGEGHEHEGHGHIEGFNEHVWYDLATAAAVATALEHELGHLDPDGADVYADNLDGFLGGIDALTAQLAAVSASRTDYLLTEPVPAYLLDAMGLHDVTPAAFPEAVEEDTDVPPAVLNDVLAIVSSQPLALLAYNEQAATGQTARVREAAESAGVPVLSFSETLPEGQSYLDWMRGNIEQTAAALGQ